MRDEQLRAIAQKLRRTRRELQRLPHDLESQERAVTESDTLTTEAKAIKLRQIRQTQRDKQQQLHRELVRLGAKADRLAREVWTLGGTREAHGRVQKLLGQQINSGLIIERAEGL